MAPQVVLISGCSSGIGLATAVLLAKDAEKRFKVYATMRNLAKKGQLEEEGQDQLGDTLIIKQMDVCSDESVTKTVQEVMETEGKIDVLCEYNIIVLILWHWLPTRTKRFLYNELLIFWVAHWFVSFHMLIPYY